MTPPVLHEGDMREVLRQFPDASFEAGAMDPPYHLTSIVERFGAAGAAPARKGKAETAIGAYARASKGFMGKEWDGGDLAFQPETWAEVLRVLKPGAHLACFGGDRTFHRMAVAMEDAGFELRRTLFWIYGSGFPKSHDVAKGIDKALGAVGSFGAPKSAAHAGWIARGAMRGSDGHEGWQSPWMDDPDAVEAAARRYIPGSPEAAEWEGWGSDLKPAFEPILLMRKPLAEKSIARNVLAHRTGAIHVGACGVPSDLGVRFSKPRAAKNGYGAAPARQLSEDRYPATILHDGSACVRELFPDGRDRFFYCAKADAADRRGSDHPTVKPQALMRWLLRLIVPPGGTVLDAFGGSGSTGWAAQAEGFRATLIERDPGYAAHIRALIADPAARPVPKPDEAEPLGGLFALAAHADATPAGAAPSHGDAGTEHIAGEVGTGSPSAQVSEPTEATP